MTEREAIERLSIEAGEAGDYEGAQLYQRALEGDAEGLAAARNHLAWAAAQGDDEPAECNHPNWVPPLYEGAGWICSTCGEERE